MTVTKRLPITRPLGARRARRKARSLAVVALLVMMFVAGAALAFWGQAIAGAITSALNAMPPLQPPQINPTDLLYTRRPGAAPDPALLLLAPLVCALAAGLLSLGGPLWRRVLLALLGLLVAVFNLVACLAYVWEFAWNEAGSGVIGVGVYLALSASATLIILIFGCWHLALARAWTWPALRGRHARGAQRWWVTLAGGGATAMLVSDLMPWGQWRASGSTGSKAHAEVVTPLATLTAGTPNGQGGALVALLVLPLCAVLCAYLITRAPRWGRAPLTFVALLAGFASLALCLLTLAQLYLHASGASAPQAGAAVGLGGAALLLTALFGLLSTPQPTSLPATIAPATIAPATIAPATTLIAAATTRRVTAPVSAPLLPSPILPTRRRAPTTRRLAGVEPVSAR